MSSSSDHIKKSSKEYSLYVCENRAIPRMSDGLKDGQRKALYLLRNKQEKIKVVSLSGQMLAENLYVHGDTSASDTISKLAAPFLNNVPLITGEGAFGSKLSPDAFGAPRYTYCKRNKAAQDLLYTDFEIVPMVDNYDGSNQSPDTFLPLIPLVLLNGISGIAVGWSTEILPHKAGDIIDSCIAVLNDKKQKVIKPYYDSYDLDVEHIEDNSWLLKGKVKIIDTSTCEITELPPQVKFEKFKEFLDGLEENDKINGYVDKSSQNISITVQFKRGTLKDKTEEYLIDFFKMKSRVTERIVVLDWNGKTVKTYDSPEKLVKDFVEWRLDWFSKRYARLLNITETNLRFAQAIKLCFDKDLPKKLPTFENKAGLEEFISTTTKKLNLDEKQIEKIVSLPSYKWTKESYQENENEIKELEETRDLYMQILGDDDMIKEIYKQELSDLKKIYG